MCNTGYRIYDIEFRIYYSEYTIYDTEYKTPGNRFQFVIYIKLVF